MKSKKHSRFTRGRWELERERSRVEYKTPPADFRDAAGIGQVVSELMGKLGLEQRQWLDDLLSAWKEVVGDAVARHTRPGRLDGNSLVVFVDSSVWFNELARYGRTQMLSNLQKRFGPDRIKSVSIQLDPDAPKKAGPDTTQKQD